MADVALRDLPREVLELLHRARTELASTSTLCCAHLGTGRPALVCASHPGGGVRCPDCAIEHAHRHDPVDELTCDRCGQVAEAIHPIVLPLIASGARILSTKRTGVLYGIVSVIGVGLCERCVPDRVAA